MTRPGAGTGLRVYWATCHPLRRSFRAGRCRECLQLDAATTGAQRREDEAIARLPRAAVCRCPAPVVWREGPLTVCRLCSREVA